MQQQKQPGFFGHFLASQLGAFLMFGLLYWLGFFDWAIKAHRQKEEAAQALAQAESKQPKTAGKKAVFVEVFDIKDYPWGNPVIVSGHNVTFKIAENIKLDKDTQRGVQKEGFVLDFLVIERTNFKHVSVGRRSEKHNADDHDVEMHLVDNVLVISANSDVDAGAPLYHRK